MILQYLIIGGVLVAAIYYAVRRIVCSIYNRSKTKAVCEGCPFHCQGSAQHRLKKTHKKETEKFGAKK